jgi:hypothetical protein
MAGLCHGVLKLSIYQNLSESVVANRSLLKQSRHHSRLLHRRKQHRQFAVTGHGHLGLCAHPSELKKAAGRNASGYQGYPGLGFTGS